MKYTEKYLNIRMALFLIFFGFSTYFFMLEYAYNVPRVSYQVCLSAPLPIGYGFDSIILGDGVFSITEQFIYFITTIIGLCCLSDCFEYWSKVK